MDNRTVKYQIRLTPQEMQAWKDAAMDNRYMELSKFIRDVMREKIGRKETEFKDWDHIDDIKEEDIEVVCTSDEIMEEAAKRLCHDKAD